MNKLLFVLLVFFSICAKAESKEPCGSVDSSQGILFCSEYSKKKADSQLNSSYQEALSRIKVQYRNSEDLGKEYLSLLKESQRAWIKLRDKNCELEAFEIEKGVEAYVVTINNCVARMSASRANYLKRISPDI